ncbi:replication protein A 70 kDa DNA-binding subunit-like [Daphnia pulex]|uniref:replication protein A 70 kDa DNA-binding subunit-like n=1 Tax=Daphnia pulex TaxID=6669 RepID=UPI001EE0E132|nr:replication protein A 70 kDa DNA-binding subunit-like [Daphnia pulex]
MEIEKTMKIYPIECITPYHKNWVMKVRVIQKSPIRTWSNDRGQGKLFSMDLIDESGEIRATAFNEECEKFYSSIKVDEVYFISNAQLKTANKNFCTLNNDYEMTFGRTTEVSHCDEDSSEIPSITFDFTSISDVFKKEKDSVIDVIGRINFASGKSSYICPLTQKETIFRDIQLVSEDGTKKINITIWGNLVDDVDVVSKPIIAFKKVKITNSKVFGTSLKTTSASIIKINPKGFLPM